MQNIKLIPEKLTSENFSDFGEVVSIESKESRTINDGFAQKFSDIATLDTLEEKGQTSAVSYTHLTLPTIYSV